MDENIQRQNGGSVTTPSDTPRTDAVEARLIRVSEMAEWARELERELNRAWDAYRGAVDSARVERSPEFPPDTNAERVKALNDLAAWLREFAEQFAAGSDPGVNLRVAADILVAQSEDLHDARPDVAAMVDRFLGWPLPKDFGPDAGISFTPSTHPMGWPVGTNLFTADQARAMFEHALGGKSKNEHGDARCQFCNACRLCGLEDAYGCKVDRCPVKKAHAI